MGTLYSYSNTSPIANHLNKLKQNFQMERKLHKMPAPSVVFLPSGCIWSKKKKRVKIGCEIKIPNLVHLSPHIYETTSAYDKMCGYTTEKNFSKEFNRNNCIQIRLINSYNFESWSLLTLFYFRK